MSDSGPNALPSWADQMRALEGVSDHLIAKWRPDGATVAETQDMNKLALDPRADTCAASTPMRAVRRSVPLWNYVQPGRTRPRLRLLDHRDRPDGVYCISGFRGTSRFVEITQQAFDMMAPAHMDGGTPLAVTHDLDDVTLGNDGYFSVVLGWNGRRTTAATGGSSIRERAAS